ncbi:hypothetical protein Hanom_Chr12g01111271 [Helianthus anomalus]
MLLVMPMHFVRDSMRIRMCKLTFSYFFFQLRGSPDINVCCCASVTILSAPNSGDLENIVEVFESSNEPLLMKVIVMILMKVIF